VADENPPGVDGGERDTLMAFLDYLRQRVLTKLSGVGDDVAHLSDLPSGTSLYWLGTHMAAVEINQFQRIVDGRTDDAIVPPPPPPAEHDRMADVLARYRAACDESRRILQIWDDLGARTRGVTRRTGEYRTVRWVLVNTINETARHLGHLDILRERLDGTTGM
jgi:hypothetical protein